MRTSLTAAALLAVVFPAGTASAHVGEIVYPIYELPTSDLPDFHDGTLGDWEEVLPDASLDHNDFVYEGGITGGIDPADLAWRVFLAWNSASKKIYMAVERLDDDYIPPGSDCCIEGSTYLRVDGDHSGGQCGGFSQDLSLEERKRLTAAEAQSYRAGPEQISQDRLLTGGGWAGPWVTLSPWADAGGFQYGESPNLSVVEFAVTAWDDLNWEGPELSTRSVLEAGKIIGFNVEVTDMDGSDRAIEFFVLALPAIVDQRVEGTTNQVTSAFADNFVDGELIPCYRGDCSGATTAVSQDSWGRIKASFR